MTPTWDLPLVLDALYEPPFEPLESVDLKVLSYNTAVLMTFASAKRVGGQYTLPVQRLHLSTPKCGLVLFQLLLSLCL